MQLAVAFGASSLFSTAGLLRLGLGIGSAIGLYLLGGTGSGSDNGKLNDLRVSCSTYGKGLPIVFGTMRTTGNMFWSTDLVERKSFFDSKGKDITGKKKAEKKGTEVYEYFANFAMALCESNEVGVDELLRIWADNNLIYDKYNPDNEDLVGPGFSTEDQDGGKTGKVGGKGKGSSGGDSGRFEFRFYTGSRQQLQDPFMVETEGPDLVPAYRGTCYLMFEDFALADFGNRIPTITAEVSNLKNRTISYKYMKPLIDSPITASNTNVRFACVDPNRYRLYVIGNATGGGRLVRTYDLSLNEEVARGVLVGEFPGIPQYNGLGHFVGFITVDLGALDVVGLSAEGQIVAVPGGGNSAPVFFIDPNTLIPLAVFGASSSDLGNDDDSVQHLDRVSPVAITNVDPISGVMTTGFLTVGVSQFGDLSTFTNPSTGTFSGGVGYSFQNTQISGSFHKVIPGLPDISSSFFYVQGNNGLIWRATTAGERAEGTEFGIVDTSVLIYTPEFLDGIDTGYVQSDPFIVVGAECVGLIEYFISNDPDREGTWAVKLDPFDGTVLWRARVDSRANLGFDGQLQQTPIMTGNKIMWLGQNGSTVGTVFEVDFRAEEMNSYALPEDAPAIDQFQAYWSVGGFIMHGGFVDDDTEFDGEWTVYLAQVDRFTQVPVGVIEIVTNISGRVGIPQDKINVVALSEQEITGYIIEEPTEARSVIEDLSKVFMFGVCESDYTLKFITNGQAPVLTIVEDSLGVVDDDTHEVYKETVTQAIDLPETCTVSYVNPDEDYQNGTQHYKRPRDPMPVMSSRDTLDISMTMAMTPDFAKQLAQKVLMSVWAEASSYDMVLPWAYLKYDPLDTILFQFNNGFEFGMRMFKMDLGADYTIQANGIVTVPSTYSSTIKAVPPGDSIHIPTSPAPVTFPVVLDVPYLTDADVEGGGGGFEYYWGAAGYTPGLKYAALERRLPPADWVPVDATAYETVYGSIMGTIPDPPHGPWATDDVTVLRLIPAHSFAFGDQQFEWESIPDAQWPSESNMIIVGDEVILYKNVDVQDDGSVFIDTLIRGWRGTELAAYNHGGKFNEQFTVGNTLGLRTASESTDLINNNFQFRAPGPGLIINLPTVLDKVLTGASLKPYAPNYFNRVADTPGAGDVRVTWARRTRYGGGLKNGTDVVPLNEETELYDAFILTDAFDPTLPFDEDDTAVVKRKFLGLTTAQFDYLVADQSTDGFAVTDTLYVLVFQVSGRVGRGFPGYDTLEPPVL